MLRERALHQRGAAEALGADVTGVRAGDAGKVLADRITWFMRELNGSPRDRLFLV